MLEFVTSTLNWSIESSKVDAARVPPILEFLDRNFLAVCERFQSFVKHSKQNTPMSHVDIPPYAFRKQTV